MDNDNFETDFYENVLFHKGDYLEVIKLLSSTYSKSCNYERSLDMDKKLIALNPNDKTVHYNIACTLALMGRKPQAIKALRESLILGFNDFDWLQEDPDLESLHDYKGFHDLLNEFKKAD